MQFLYPYMMLCYSAGYALLQTLDGLNIVSTSFTEMNAQGYPISSYWSPEKVAIMFGALLVEFVIILSPLAFLSSWILAKKKGMIICFILIITPGFLSLFDYFPHVRWLPLTYTIGGSGDTGNAAGIGSLSFIGLICGWILTILIADIFSTGEKFRQWTDIFIILTAIASGVFWVSDRADSGHKVQYEQTINDINDSARYLLVQVKDYSRECDDSNLLSTASCQWASFVQEKLENIASTKNSTIKYILPETLDEFYQIPRNKKISVEKIRLELQDYNKRKCINHPVSKGVSLSPLPTQWCQTPPGAYCNAIQEGKFRTDIWDRFSVANECVTTSIMRYRDILLQEENRLSLSKNNPHLRWGWFIIMSFILGWKVANVMTKIFNLDNREEVERCRVKYLIVNVAFTIKRVNIVCLKIIKSLLCRQSN